MDTVRKMSPHAAIVIANMYYVFWGIDRVNKSMNFIDNEYTKFLLVVLIALCGADLWALLKVALRQRRRNASPASVRTRLGLMGLNALLCAVLLILLIIDLFSPDSMLFLNEFVKFLILLTCILTQLHAVLLIARDRAAVRMMARRAAQRRPSPSAARRSPAPARTGAPRSSYGSASRDGYGSSSRSGSTSRSSYGSTSRSGYGSTSRDGYGSSSRSGYGSTSRSGSYGSTSRSSYGSTSRSSGYGSTSRGGGRSSGASAARSSRTYDDRY